MKYLNGIDGASQQAHNFADGSSANDLATYGQVQALLNGLIWKQSVRVASTANLTIASPGATIDGITMASGDRVLLKNQTTASQNGIYVYATSSTPLTRAPDFNSSTNVKAGSAVSVLDGTLGAPAGLPTQWVLTLDPDTVITVGTTALPFTQFGAAGNSYTATASGGLQLVSGAFSVKLPALSGLITDSTGTYVDTSIVVKKYAQAVGDGTSTVIAVTHGLNTQDVIVEIQDAVSHAVVSTDWVATSGTVVTFTFAVAPTTGQYRVTIHG